MPKGQYHWYSPKHFVLTFGKDVHFPPSISHLSIYHFFDFLPSFSFPTTLAHLTIKSNIIINYNNGHFLPSSLTHLTAFAFYGTLPPFLQYLKIEGSSDDDKLSCPSFPPSLTYLNISKFVGILPDLPSSLLTFKLKSTTHSFPSFPPSLTSLSILGTPRAFLPPFPSSLLKYSGTLFTNLFSLLPSSLISLKVPFREEAHMTFPISNFPHLRILEVNPRFYHFNFDSSPPLHHLSFGYILPSNFNITIPPVSSLICPFELPRDCPKSIKLLITTNLSRSKLDWIPPSVKELAYFGGPHDFLPPCPPSLSHLIINNGVCDLLPAGLPPSLTHLKVAFFYNNPLQPLPPSLQYFDLGNTFKDNIPPLPSSLQYLIVGERFNHPLSIHLSNLKYLRIKNAAYSHPLPLLPKSLLWIVIRGNLNREKIFPKGIPSSCCFLVD